MLVTHDKVSNHQKLLALCIVVLVDRDQRKLLKSMRLGQYTQKTMSRLVFYQSQFRYEVPIKYLYNLALPENTWK